MSIDLDFDLSLEAGPTNIPLHEHTIGEALSIASRRWANELALVSRHQGIRRTWSQLNEDAEKVACGLFANGIRKGDRVGIWSPNRAEWTVLQFATAKIGAILVNINPAYRPSELRYALNKVGCSAVVAADRFKSSNYIEMLHNRDRGATPELRLLVSLGEGEFDGFLPWRDLMAGTDHGLLKDIAVTLDRNDPINIQFTSGTTGAPKGATLSHRNILNNGRFTGMGINLSPADRICIPVPLYHCFGMVMGNLAALTSGAAMVYPGEGFDALDVLDAIHAEGCTALYGVPTMFMALLERLSVSNRNVSTLRTGIMAGALCPVDTMRDVIALLNMSEVTIAYGMTETSPVTSQTAIDDPMEYRVSTVGRVHPHAEVKIVGPDGAIVPHGVQGEYCARGYAVMRGYWGDPDRTEEAIDAEGWMHTGDLATMDHDGYVRITGRIKDVIIRGGENIYPAEIEEFLRTHPDIADAQVFAVADERFGEAVCAWVIAKTEVQLSEDDILAYCQGQIAHYKLPRYVRIVEQFVMTVTGKPQKTEMRKIMESELKPI